MSITAQQVKDVLSEDDFGHELRVGDILANVQEKMSPLTAARMFTPTCVEQAQHGGTYRDPVTDKPRQFDYRCRIFKRPSSGQQWSKYILMALECKNVDTDSPVVVCGRPRTTDESFHHIIEITEKPGIKKVSGTRSIYYPNEFVGKSIVRIKNNNGKPSSSREGESEIYDKWSQALASSHDIANGSIYGQFYLKLPPYCWAFIMSLVVLPDGALWQAKYYPNGTLPSEPVQVNQCAFYVDHKLLVGMPLIQTHIHFVTLRGLSELLEGLLMSDAQWDKIISNISEPVL